MDTPPALCLDLKLAIIRLRQKERLNQEFIRILYQFISLPLVIGIFDEYGLSPATVENIVDQLIEAANLGNQDKDIYTYNHPLPIKYLNKVKRLDSDLWDEPDLLDTGPENQNLIYNYCLYRLYFMLDFRHVKGFSTPLQLIEHPSSPIEHLPKFCDAIFDQVNVLRIETAQITLAKMIALNPPDWYSQEVMDQIRPEFASFLYNTSLHFGELQQRELNLLQWQIRHSLIRLDHFFTGYSNVRSVELLVKGNSPILSLRTTERGERQIKLEEFIMNFEFVPPPVLRDNQAN